MHKSKSSEPKLVSVPPILSPHPQTASPEYAAALENLKAAVSNLENLRDREAELEARSDSIGTDREELLAALSEEDAPSEEQLEDLQRLSARFDATTARLKNVTPKVRAAEEQLQLALTLNFLPPFRRLFQSLLIHRFEQSKVTLLALIEPGFQNVISDLVVWKTRAVSEIQALEIFIPSGAESPLCDTFAGSGWSQRRPDTVRLIEAAVATALGQAHKLLQAAEAEPGFTIPSSHPPCPEQAPTAQEATPQLATALPNVDQGDWSPDAGNPSTEALLEASP